MDILVKTEEYVNEAGEKFPIQVCYDGGYALAIHFADFFKPLPNGMDNFVGRDWYNEAVRHLRWRDETKHYVDWLAEVLKE